MSRIKKIPLVGTAKKLSMAVYPIDDYSNGGIIGDVEISLKNQNVKPVRNPSGYYLFFDLSDGSYTVQVTNTIYYFDEENVNVNVQLADLDAQNPVVNITLKPKPPYPFPSSATLIRGFLQDSQHKGVSGAVIKVRGSDIQTRTAENGEFVIYFRKPWKDHVTATEGKKLVKIHEENPVLEITHPDHRKKTKSVTVTEGHTVSLSITYS